MDTINMRENTEELLNYEEIMKALFVNYPNAIWLKDKNRNLINANRRFYELFSSKNQEGIKKIENEIFANNETKIFNIITDKFHQPLSVTGIPILDNNNNVNYVLYITHNLPEEDEKNEDYFVNRFQLNALLENIPKIIYMKDLSGSYITGTKHSKDFFLNGFDYIHDIQLNFNSIEKSLIIEDISVLERKHLISYNMEINDIAGVPHWYTIYKAPIKDYNNETIGLIVMAKNIDDEKLLQAQKESFVASLGHDLKNPTLAQIRALELLLKGDFGKLNNEQTELLRMVLDSCKYMNAMLTSLLATYKNERGVVKLIYEDISLIELCDECISEMRYIAKDKNIEIIESFVDDKLNIFGDKVQIKRVIMNILSNSIKYGKKNTKIKLRLYNEENFSCIDIENQSPYIPKETQKAIFAQYVSFAEAHNEFGIGIGLYASKKIVEAHNGEIFVESYKDDRNIFGFKLPNNLIEPLTNRSVKF